MGDDSCKAYFTFGNTYELIPSKRAKLDRSGQHRKIHDWTLYVDVLAGNQDIIERVTFDLGPSFKPNTYVCTYPIPITNGEVVREKRRRTSSLRSEQQKVWRFATRQQSYGSVQATIKIRGVGGTVWEGTHPVCLSDVQRKSPTLVFNEWKNASPLRALKLPGSQKFGIELELTSEGSLEPERVAGLLERSTMQSVVVFRNYSQGHATTSKHRWKLVPDSSIACNISQPNCNKFELVSPILMGGDGLGMTHGMMKTMAEIRPKLQVNKSMGFHVHVDVSHRSLEELIKICQQFIKYEEVMDSFMPPSRRDGSPECERFFRSNLQSVSESLSSPYNNSYSCVPSVRACHDALARCRDLIELSELMNGNGRYHKLNLQNLVTGRQPTLEFRQHSATMSYEKVSFWVRFCVAFCCNSARLAAPTPFRDSRSRTFRFEALFQYVIKDRALRNFYHDRQQKQKQKQKYYQDDRNAPRNSACCDACSTGKPCVDRVTSADQVHFSGFIEKA